MRKLILPEGYESKFSVIETHQLVWQVRDFVEKELKKELGLVKVVCPLFVTSESGIQDDLNGIEKPASFSIKDQRFEIVHSLAKWKRVALNKFSMEGLITNMIAIRKDEELDNIHSVTVDQYDWERVISKEQRTEKFLKSTIRRIYGCFRRTLGYLKGLYPKKCDLDLPEEIFFIDSYELEEMYPEDTPFEREKKIVKEKKVVFLMKIGGKLKGGMVQDQRAPDYDDWKLNGDILFWNDILGISFEISSMGIRVDAQSLEIQLKESKCESRKKFEYHQQILKNELPLTIGGGIGISRVVQFFLQKAHIGEVQSSYWPEKMRKECEKCNIHLL